jgi:hypothetical protein
MSEALILFAGIVSVVGVFTLLDWLGERRDRRTRRRAGFAPDQRGR